MQLVKQSNCKKIFAIDSFDAEFRKLFGTGGDFKQYQKKFAYHLSLLDNASNIQQALQHKDIEAIKGEDNLYSIRHVSQRNPRVIFFHEIEEGVYILLCSFFERNTSDYNLAIKRAKGILKELGL